MNAQYNQEDQVILPYDELQVGDLVEHPQWGIGSILHRSGRGEHTKFVVTFPDLDGNGQKKLKAAFAKLRKIEDKKEPEEEIVEETPVEEVKTKESESTDDSDDDEEEVFDEKEAARALNIEDETEEVTKVEVADEDWDKKEDE